MTINSHDDMPMGGALKLNVEGGVLTEHEAAHHDLAAEDSLTLNVQDNDSGMSNATKKQAFNPLY